MRAPTNYVQKQRKAVRLQWGDGRSRKFKYETYVATLVVIKSAVDEPGRPIDVGPTALHGLRAKENAKCQSSKLEDYLETAKYPREFDFGPLT